MSLSMPEKVFWEAYTIEYDFFFYFKSYTDSSSFSITLPQWCFFCYEVRLTTLQIKVYKIANILLFSNGFACALRKVMFLVLHKHGW